MISSYHRISIQQEMSQKMSHNMSKAIVVAISPSKKGVIIRPSSFVKPLGYLTVRVVNVAFRSVVSCDFTESRRSARFSLELL